MRHNSQHTLAVYICYQCYQSMPTLTLYYNRIVCPAWMHTFRLPYSHKLKIFIYLIGKTHSLNHHKLVLCIRG